MTTLSHVEARRVYDCIGRKQDTQAFYEDRATSLVISHLHLATAQAVFEFGCGTGRVAASLLADHLPQTATYRAVDISPVMVALAKQRLARFGSRAEVKLSDGGPPIHESSGSYDCFISNFVLDLLSLEDIAQVINEAHRILRPEGLLGLSGLTTGFTVTSRAFAWLLAQIHAIRPSLVGGCRSLKLLSLLPQHQWKICHHARLAPLCIPVEAVVAVRTWAPPRTRGGDQDESDAQLRSPPAQGSSRCRFDFRCAAIRSALVMASRTQSATQSFAAGHIV
jgi:ubiquinone/menaquinone biosynthesis C-methylase UbiE